jgi:general stress protein 26
MREMATNDVDRVWELMKKITFCMLANWNGKVLRSRPMAAYLRREEGAIYFLTDARHLKDDEIKQYPQVCAAFADAGGKYVSLSGYTSVSNDRAKIKELWGTAAKAWWDSPEDPNIRVLKLTPEEAEYWDGPGTIVGYIKMATAALTDSRPDYGDNRKVAMR